MVKVKKISPAFAGKSNVDHFYKIALIFLYITTSVLFLIWTALILIMLSDKGNIEKSDFLAFYTSGTFVKQNLTKELYNLPLQAEKQNIILGKKLEDPLVFRYLPHVSLFFYIFSGINFYKAFLFFLIINFFTIMLILNLIKKWFVNVTSLRIWFLLPFAYYPIALTMIKGQVSIILTLILLLIYRFHQKRPFLSGALWSIFLIKPQFFIFGLPILYLISKSKKYFVGGVLLFCGIWMSIGIFLVGLNSLINYPSYTLYKEGIIYESYNEWNTNLNLSTVLTPIINRTGGGLKQILSIEAAIYILLLMFITRKINKIPFESQFIAFTIITLVMSFHSYPYDYALVLLPLVIILNMAIKNKNPGNIFLLMLMIILPNTLIKNSTFASVLIMFIIGLSYIFVSTHKSNLKTTPLNVK